jgi:hypothetical protein
MQVHQYRILPRNVNQVLVLGGGIAPAVETKVGKVGKQRSSVNSFQTLHLLPNTNNNTPTTSIL